MKAHKVTGRSVVLNAGKVGLTEEQAKARASSLVKSGKEPGVYDIASPIEFKAGEVFEFDGVISKNIAADLEDKGASKEDKVVATEFRARRRGRTPRDQEQD